QGMNLIQRREERTMRVLQIFLMGLVLGVFVATGESWSAAPSHTTRTDSGGGVTVKVTYLESKTRNELRFLVVVDTHSVHLDTYDLKAIAVLRDETGKNYLPMEAVENKGSGHHREATVIFPKVSSEAKRLEIVI